MFVYCEAPRKRYPATPCGGFVARVPDGSRLLREVKHSSEAEAGSVVAPCSQCRKRYEIALPRAA